MPQPARAALDAAQGSALPRAARPRAAGAPRGPAGRRACLPPGCRPPEPHPRAPPQRDVAGGIDYCRRKVNLVRDKMEQLSALIKQRQVGEGRRRRGCCRLRCPAGFDPIRPFVSMGLIKRCLCSSWPALLPRLPGRYGHR